MRFSRHTRQERSELICEARPSGWRRPRSDCLRRPGTWPRLTLTRGRRRRPSTVQAPMLCLTDCNTSHFPNYPAAASPLGEASVARGSLPN